METADGVIMKGVENSLVRVLSLTSELDASSFVWKSFDM